MGEPATNSAWQNGTTSGDEVVYVIDDDEQSRKAVTTLLRAMRVEVESYASAEDFLSQYNGHRPGCLVTDVRMLGMSGLELQEKLQDSGITMSVVVLTAFASTPTIVRAMRNGAVTLLEKPCDEDQLWNAVRSGLEIDRRNSIEQQRLDEIRDRLDSLTPKEREVFRCIVGGDANKVAAGKLGISVRTVEIHRRNIFEKMGAESLAKLVCMALAVEPENRPCMQSDRPR